ncbi:lutropin-choriogonadotropic hormone receptor [Diorhabda carinulata]|uniref:lutropin-choriogonadotropic hormone receptor n=1 Tax=Diorhabda carinulata TaxID=1163345 RepID=UPI0025A03141|nr:lutropin-choriogonadotropic hormone receptor [Diorhabda carinulata]
MISVRVSSAMICMVFLIGITLASCISRKPFPNEITFCCNFKNSQHTNVHCYGKDLLEIPNNLSRSLMKLSITDAKITHITKREFDPYREEMRDVTLSHLPNLRVIEDGTFSDMPNLRTLYISNAPQIMFLNGLLLGVTSDTFYSLRIVWTRLMEVPDLYHLPANNTMFLLDLDHNNIQKLSANSIKVSAQQVTINFNPLQTVDDYAFNGSQIAELQMHSNFHLKTLGDLAFSGISSLRLLDLSQTSIEGLPSEGLQELETLKIEDTHTMQTIPSIYDLRNLKTAKLTHSFHCCAFQYPAQHNPGKHAQFADNMKKICMELAKSGSGILKRKRRSIHKEWPSSQERLSRGHLEDILRPLKGKVLEEEKGKIIDTMMVDEEDEEYDGFFHSDATKVNDTQLATHCGNIIFRMPEVECLPDPDALNPCEDIMGMSWLRISVWCVVILALLGNLAVIIVFLFSQSDMNVSRFLILNLAIADFCMGLYLLLIAAMDFHSVGQYFNFAFNWQYGIGCQLAGFLTVFSSHLSIYTLTVVTLERWFAITYAIYLTKRITIKCAFYILFGGWVYSIIMAVLPILRVSNYSSTSICLPMESKRIVDKIYLYTVIFINGSAFALIVFCYVQIYLSLGYETRRASTQGEMTIAKKMSLLILVDFATVAPIAFFGLTALAGYPLIGVTKSKILLVFFYPLNACANPYLYAVMTAQYRHDFMKLISRCKVCHKEHTKEKTGCVLLSTRNGTEKTLENGLTPNIT